METRVRVPVAIPLAAMDPHLGALDDMCRARILGLFRRLRIFYLSRLTEVVQQPKA